MLTTQSHAFHFISLTQPFGISKKKDNKKKHTFVRAFCSTAVSIRERSYELGELSDW